MKEWKCPDCKRTRKYKEGLVIKVCYFCQIKMVVIEYGS